MNNETRQKNWTVEDIKQVLRELDGLTGLDSSNMKVTISKRMTKVMGSFEYLSIFEEKLMPIGFKFAHKLIDGSYTPQTVKRTIIHEYVHYLTSVKYNKSNHDETFKYYDKLLGGTGDVYFTDKPVWSKDEQLKSNKPTYKYIIKCACCNKTVAKRNRLTENLLYNYKSSCCNAKLLAYKIE